MGQFRKLRTLQWNGAEVGIMKESRNVEPLSFLPDELTYFMSKVSARLTFPLSRNKSQAFILLVERNGRNIKFT